jgi:hypothetical protein
VEANKEQGGEQPADGGEAQAPAPAAGKKRKLPDKSTIEVRRRKPSTLGWESGNDGQLKVRGGRWRPMVSDRVGRWCVMRLCAY